MKLRTHPALRRRLALLLCAALAPACGVTHADLPDEVVEAPPYQVGDDGVLTVRPDLVAALVTAPVRPAGEAATVQGVGHLGFVPGAAYAVRTPFEGYVEQVHVRIGERVAAGALLATLRSGEVARVRAEVRRLGAALTSERDALERARRLLTAGAGSAREVVESQGRIAAMLAELEGARQSLAATRTGAGGRDKVELRAHAAGDVLARNIEPGERVSAQDTEPALVIGDAQALQVVARFPERDAAHLREGAACTYTVPALGSAPGLGTVAAVTQAVDPVTRTVRVVCLPAAGAAGLRAEMAAQVAVAVGAPDDADASPELVPRRAVLLRRDARVVLVAQGPGRLVRREVSTGLSVGDDVQVLSGLSVGEQVVVEGAVLLDGELDRLL